MRVVVGLALSGCIVAAGATPALSQAEIINLFGSLIRSSVGIAAQAAWEKLPSSEIACVNRYLLRRGSSINAVVQQGIAPTDPKVFDARAECRGTLDIKIDAVPAKSIFAVDGLALGGKVAVESAIYNEYRCGPSDQFPNVTWCQRRKTEASPRGQYLSSNSILHSADGTAFYVNRYLEPAFFSGNEANDDISRLSARFGSSRLISMPRQPDISNGLIAMWGDVTLEPLDQRVLAQLAAGQDVRAGLLIDHIGNFRRSAQRGLPVYRISGGAGYVWAASWNAGGVGTLRFLTVDAKALAAATGGADRPVLADQAPALPSVGAIDPSPKPLPTSAPVQPISEAPKVTEASAAMQRIKETLKRISEQRDGLPSQDLKSRLDDVASKLATASEQLEVPVLRSLLRECDAALAVFNEAADFKAVSSVSSRKVELVDGALSKISFDAPLVQEIKASVEAVKNAQNDGNVGSLRIALAKLNQTYDPDKLSRLAEAKKNGFDTAESYEEFKINQAKLSKSGIRLNPR